MTARIISQFACCLESGATGAGCGVASNTYSNSDGSSHGYRGVTRAHRGFRPWTDAAGFQRFEMGATLTGVPLYQARGYVEIKRTEVPLANGASLPVVRMAKAACRS